MKRIYTSDPFRDSLVSFNVVAHIFNNDKEVLEAQRTRLSNHEEKRLLLSLVHLILY